MIILKQTQSSIKIKEMLPRIRMGKNYSTESKISHLLTISSKMLGS